MIAHGAYGNPRIGQDPFEPDQPEPPTNMPKQTSEEIESVKTALAYAGVLNPFSMIREPSLKTLERPVIETGAKNHAHLTRLKLPGSPSTLTQ